MEVVAWQAVFGSDPNREAYNILRGGLVDERKIKGYWANAWNVLYGFPLTSKKRKRKNGESQ